MEVQSHGVWVDAFQVSVVNLAFWFGVVRQI